MYEVTSRAVQAHTNESAQPRRREDASLRSITSVHGSKHLSITLEEERRDARAVAPATLSCDVWFLGFLGRKTPARFLSHDDKPTKASPSHTAPLDVYSLCKEPDNSSGASLGGFSARVEGDG